MTKKVRLNCQEQCCVCLCNWYELFCWQAGTSDTNKISKQGDIALLLSTSPSLSQLQGKTGNAAGVEISLSPNYFFKGFLVWSLWGYLPINYDDRMKSLLFTEAKVPTLFGSKTASRQSFKQWQVRLHQDGGMLMGRHGTKRSVIESRSTASMTLHLCPNDNGNEQQIAIRHQLDRFSAKYGVERELQKQSALQVSIVWDKICALTRKCNRATDTRSYTLCALNCIKLLSSYTVL